MASKIPTPLPCIPLRVPIRIQDRLALDQTLIRQFGGIHAGAAVRGGRGLVAGVGALREFIYHHALENVGSVGRI
jgi:hypothetical protein